MKLIAFTVADKEYGLGIDRVREVIRIKEITRIPASADFVEGVINLRSRVIPVINLREKLKLEKSGPNSLNRVIIVRLNNNFIGIAVDEVSKVISIDTDDIAPPDDVLKNAEYLIGIGNFQNKLILIIDIAKLLTEKDKTSIEGVYEKVEIKGNK